MTVAQSPTEWVDHRQRWTSPQWRTEMSHWVSDSLARRGERVTRIDEFRVRVWSAVLRIESDAGVRWAKETHPGSVSEAAATVLAHRVAPNLVIAPLAVDTARGRILTADAGSLRVDGTVPFSTRVALAERGAELQRALLPQRAELLAAGLPDLQPDRLAAHLRRRIEQAGELPADHPMHLDADARVAVRERERRVNDLVKVLRDSGVPSTLEHNDLHVGNAFAVDGAIRIADFGDAVVAHPFGSLRVLLGSSRRNGGVDDRGLERIRSAYLDSWRDFGDLAILRRAADAAIALTGMHRWELWWRTCATTPAAAVEPYRPVLLPLLRSVTDLEAALIDY